LRLIGRGLQISYLIARVDGKVTEEEIATLTRARLATWGEYLARNHSTPAVIIGIRQDAARGELYMAVPDNLSRDEVMCLMRAALSILEAGREARDGLGEVN
jgi:hypothetical protein